MTCALCDTTLSVHEVMGKDLLCRARFRKWKSDTHDFDWDLILRRSEKVASEVPWADVIILEISSCSLA
jgi:hypothetical protein